MAVNFRDILDDLQDTADRFGERTGQPAWLVKLVEPGWTALLTYRLARLLYDNGFRAPGLLIARQAARNTGIHIHPSARIGRRCVLMAGPGVLIGPATVVGDDCLIEPGVMIVGGPDAHPTLGDRVVLEAGAIVTGEVFIGHDVRVVAGSLVGRDVVDGGVAVGVPGRVLSRAQARPDPDAKAIKALADRLYHLEEQHQILAFTVHRHSAGGERWKTRNPDAYGPIPEVEDLVDGAGI